MPIACLLAARDLDDSHSDGRSPSPTSFRAELLESGLESLDLVDEGTLGVLQGEGDELEGLSGRLLGEEGHPLTEEVGPACSARWTEAMTAGLPADADLMSAGGILHPRGRSALADTLACAG